MRIQTKSKKVDKTVDQIANDKAVLEGILSQIKEAKENLKALVFDVEAEKAKKVKAKEDVELIESDLEKLKLKLSSLRDDEHSLALKIKEVSAVGKEKIKETQDKIDELEADNQLLEDKIKEKANILGSLNIEISEKEEVLAQVKGQIEKAKLEYEESKKQNDSLLKEKEEGVKALNAELVVLKAKEKGQLKKVDETEKGIREAERLQSEIAQDSKVLLSEKVELEKELLASRKELKENKMASLGIVRRIQSLDKREEEIKKLYSKAGLNV